MLPFLWVLKVKVNKDSKSEEAKARLVVHGGQQVAGQDYTSKFTLMPALNLFKFIMAIRTQCRMKTRQINWKGAYLNAFINHNVYVRQPVGMEVPRKEMLVCKLNKPVYRMCKCIWMME